MPSSRIPAALQQVFVSSQGGGDVEKIAAPNQGIAFRIFKRSDKSGNKKAPKKTLAPTAQAQNPFAFLSRRSRGPTAAEATRKAMKKNVCTYDIYRCS